MHIYVISQVIVIIAYILCGIGFLKKEKKQILFFSTLFNISILIHYTLLNAVSGITSSILNITRNLIIIHNLKKNKDNSKLILILLCTASVFSMGLFYNSIIDLFPMTISIVGILSYGSESTRVLRICNLTCSLCYIVYAIPLKSFVTIICEIYLIIATLIGLFKYELIKGELKIMKYIVSGIKKFIYRLKGYKIEKNVFIGKKVCIKGNNVFIGRDTYIDDNVKIIAKDIKIGCNSIFFHDTLIYCLNNLTIGERNKISRNCIIKANNFLSKEELWCNENVEIGGGGWKKETANIEIGPYTHIGKNSHLNVCWPIIIKGLTGIGMDTMIFTHSSGHGQSIIEGYTNVQGKIIIEKNVSIFSRCIITPNTHIKRGVTIGANSFVKGVLEEKSFYAGSPAKKIKEIIGLNAKEKEEKIIEFLNEIVDEKIIDNTKKIFRLKDSYLIFVDKITKNTINYIESSNYNITCVICLYNKNNYNKGTVIDLSTETISGDTTDVTEMVRDNFRRVGIILKPLSYKFKKLSAVQLKKNMIEL